MKTKILLLLGIAIMTGMSAMAQTDPDAPKSVNAIDRKGTIVTVIDASTKLITKAGNGLTKLGDNTLELGGTLTKTATIVTCN